LQKELKDFKTAKNEEGVKKSEQLIKDKGKDIEQFNKDFIAKNPEALISKVLRVNEQIDIPELPIKENGNSDSTWGWRYYKNHYWDYVDLNDDRLLRTPVFTSKLSTFITNVIIQDNDSIIKEADLLIERVRLNKEMFKYIVSWITYHYETSKIMGQDEVFVHMAEKYYATNQCWWVTESTVDNMNKRAAQIKAILIGAKAPELIMPDTNNVFISCYTPKSKFTIMIFWDPDCGHCKTEVPKLRDFYTAQKDSLGIEVYAISTDTDLNRWKKFIIDNKLVWINVGGNTANIDFRKVYDIYSTPVIYILDENKKIIAKRISVEDLPDFFKQYNRMIEHNKKK
jgi:thiol-disulfide isomerase/thioredoxin